MTEGLATEVKAINLPSFQVASNFFKPTFNPGRCLHTYSLAISPTINSDSRALRGKLIYGAETMLLASLGAHVVSGLTIYAANAVSDPFEVQTESGGVQYTLSIKYAHRVGLEEAARTPEATMVLNVVLKRVLKALGLKQVTQLPKYYDERRTCDVPELGLEIWRGYAVQLSTYSDQILLNVDFSSKIIHTRSFLDELCDYRDRGADWKQAASSNLEGRIVMAKYGNRRCYKVDEIVYSKSPLDSLSVDNPISFVEYYQRQYEADIKHNTQPLIRSRVKKNGGDENIYLIPELVTLTGLDPEMRSNFKTMSRISESTRLTPSDRMSVSTSLPSLVNSTDSAKKILSGFDLTINPQPMMVTAYDLSGEAVFVDQQTNYQIDDCGNFILRSKGILTPVKLTEWAVVAPQIEMEPAKQTITALFNRLREMSDGMAQPQIVWYNNAQPLDVVVPNFVKTQPVQFLVVLLTRRLKDRYPKLKKFTSTAYSVPSQVVVIPLMEKRARSIIDKVALQIQAKMGAQLWTVRPSSEFGKYVMIVGIDIFHDIVNRKKSVLGFCATVHPNFSKYYSTTSMQETGQELVTAIGNLFVEACHVFREKARQLPETVIFFRDGVSESQMLAVRDYEVETVLRACGEVEQDYAPRLIYTVVVKKTNAKFFTETRKGVANPRPGTLITTEVVPNPGDFYLISHYANQGISAPTLYKTVFVSHPKEFNLESLARLAYKLCHMYYNWSGAVKIPAPCMMAHKIAYFVGQCVHEAVNQSIRTLAFYL